MYRLETFNTVIWLVCVALETYLLLRIRANRTRVPFFFAYLIFSALKSGILLIAAAVVGQRAYYTVFGVTSILATSFEIFILLEVLNGLKRWSTIPPETVRICLLLCVALAICLTGMNFSIDIHSFGDLYVTLARMMALMEAAVFVTVVLFSALWGTSWQHETGIVAGFGLTAVVRLAAATRFSGAPESDALLIQIYVLGHVTALVAWVWTISARDSTEASVRTSSPAGPVLVNNLNLRRIPSAGKDMDEELEVAAAYRNPGAIAFSHDSAETRRG